MSGFVRVGFVVVTVEGAKRGPKQSVWAEGGNFKNGEIRNAEKKDAYAAWLSLPPGEREPKLKIEMAELLGVTIQTLINWGKRPEVVSQVYRTLANELKVDRLPIILDRLMDILEHGQTSASQVSAANTLLKHMQWMTERKEELDVDGLVASMSDDDLRRALDAMHDRFESDRAAAGTAN